MKGSNDYQDYRYDDHGNLVERTFPQRGIKFVTKYDSVGREVESLKYTQEKLESVTRSTYENNRQGDWIKRHETCWFASSPDEGFTPWTEYYREINYYGESGN